MVKKAACMLLAMFLTSSCALASFQIEYFEFFEEAYKRKCLVLPVNAYFAHLEPQIAGYCIPGFGILFNEDRWESFGPYQRRELVFHELGHCTLGLEHSEPGLMAPVMHKEEDLKINWSIWIEQLFSVCKPKENK